MTNRGAPHGEVLLCDGPVVRVLCVDLLELPVLRKHLLWLVAVLRPAPWKGGEGEGGKEANEA